MHKKPNSQKYDCKRHSSLFSAQFAQHRQKQAFAVLYMCRRKNFHFYKKFFASLAASLRPRQTYIFKRDFKAVQCIIYNEDVQTATNDFARLYIRLLECVFICYARGGYFNVYARLRNDPNKKARIVIPIRAFLSCSRALIKSLRNPRFVVFRCRLCLLRLTSCVLLQSIRHNVRTNSRYLCALLVLRLLHA